MFSLVEIVEETTGSSLPAEPERDSEPVRLPISRLRAPPLSAGYSFTDPPVEVREAEESAAWSSSLERNNALRGWCADQNHPGQTGSLTLANDRGLVNRVRQGRGA